MTFEEWWNSLPIDKNAGKHDLLVAERAARAAWNAAIKSNRDKLPLNA